MTSEEYLLELFKVSADQLGCPYTKTTPERLQHWSIELNNNSFIALLGMEQSATVNKYQSDLISYDLTFIAALETNEILTEDIESNEKVNYWQKEVTKLASRFIQFIQRNENITMTSYSLEEFFKDGRFLGVGKGISMTIEMPDLDDYCNDFCNKQTEKLDCE